MKIGHFYSFTLHALITVIIHMWSYIVFILYEGHGTAEARPVASVPGLERQTITLPKQVIHDRTCTCSDRSMHRFLVRCVSSFYLPSFRIHRCTKLPCTSLLTHCSVLKDHWVCIPTISCTQTINRVSDNAMINVSFVYWPTYFKCSTSSQNLAKK